MRALFSLGLLVAIAGSAAGQDTSVVIRETSRNSRASGDTIITIRRPGQPDRVVKLSPSTSAELRASLERQLQESRRGFAQIREMQADRARRDVEMTGELRNLMIERQPMRSEAMAGSVMLERTPLMVDGERAVELRERAPENAVLERRPVTVEGQRIAELRELNAGAVTMARRAREMASRSLEAFAARPRIGITVDLNARDSDKYGAYVSAVTPGGPAGKAGVRTADIITSIAGKSLTAPDSIRRNVDESGPGVRLIELVSRLEVGKPVPLEIRRGNDTRKLSLTPDNDPTFTVSLDGEPMVASMTPRAGGTGAGMVWSGRVSPMPQGVASEAPVPAQFFRNFARAGEDGHFSFVTAFGTALADLELAALNEKLGSYFGVSEGVLVIDVPDKGGLGLVPGDVVTAVDGRKVSTPNQLMRILGTYEKNEEFKLQVTRQKRAETVTAKLP